MMDEIKLKPCPFCGGKASVFKAYRVVYGINLGLGTAYTVACETERCVLEGGGGLFDSEYSAIKAWNRRANDG